MNKNGWGLRAELWILLLFVFCLIIATLGLSQFGLLGDADTGAELYGDSDNSVEYSSLENKLASAALEYYNERYYNEKDIVIIKLGTLRSNGKISRLYDKYGKECSGYAKIINSKTAIGYIRCSKFKTSGYDKANE